METIVYAPGGYPTRIVLTHLPLVTKMDKIKQCQEGLAFYPDLPTVCWPTPLPELDLLSEQRRIPSLMTALAQMPDFRRAQVRTAHLPQVRAGLRNTATSLLRLAVDFFRNYSAPPD